MSLRGRLNPVAKQIGADERPLTVILVEAGDRAPGRFERTNAAGLLVVEIVFDTDGGPVTLPAPPYKLVCRVDPVDLV
jgi:hypothetical protein